MENIYSLLKKTTRKKVNDEPSEMDILVNNSHKLIGQVKWKLQHAWHDDWDEEGVGCLNLNGRLVGFESFAFFLIALSHPHFIILFPLDFNNCVQNCFLCSYRSGCIGRHDPIKDEGIDELIPCIDLLGDRIKELGLPYQEITSKGAIKLFNWLNMKKSKITKLVMRGNNLDDECMQSLGEYIQGNQYLETVSLESNKLTSVGIEILAPYLDGNTALKILDLQENRNLWKLPASLLVKMIESSHLCYINLWFTSINQKEMIVIPLAQNVLKYGLPNLMLNHL